MKTKIFILAAAIALVIACSIGSTVAWLSAETSTLTNVFTAGDIDIGLDESDDLDLTIVPGKTITKDPKITVKADSEACWLFVKIDKSSNFDSFMTFDVASGWTQFESGSNVYYRKVSASTADQVFHVLKDDAVKVKDSVTKTDLNGTMPTLSFTAYAIQQDNIPVNTSASELEQAKSAWELIAPDESGTPTPGGDSGGSGGGSGGGLVIK